MVNFNKWLFCLVLNIVNCYWNIEQNGHPLKLTKKVVVEKLVSLLVLLFITEFLCACYRRYTLNGAESFRVTFVSAFHILFNFTIHAVLITSIWWLLISVQNCKVFSLITLNGSDFERKEFEPEVGFKPQTRYRFRFNFFSQNLIL